MTRRPVSPAGLRGFAVLVILVVVALAPAASAQGRQGGAPPPPQNLQVFPSDMALPQLFPIMQAFNAALGVTCSHCHQFVGPNDPANDFAADTKPQKEIARDMIRMVRQINPMIASAVAPKAADEVAQVGCAVCHRGAAIPVVEPGSPGAPPPGRGRGRGRGN